MRNEISGNKAARDLIHWYLLWTKAPGDPGAEAMVGIKFDEWEKEKK